MAEVHTLLHMSREEAEALRQLAQYSHRVKDVIAYLDAQNHQPIEHCADEAGARFRALEAMFHDVLLVLNVEQKQQLLTQWRDDLLDVTPAFLLPSNEVSLDDLERDAGHSVVQAAVQVLERDLWKSE